MVKSGLHHDCKTLLHDIDALDYVSVTMQAIGPKLRDTNIRLKYNLVANRRENVENY